MSGPPYTKLFWGEYHRETNHFSREEHGAYLLLISEAWDHGGCIPGDEATLARLIKGTPEDWARLAPTLLARFRPARGRWRHPWISDQLGAFTAVSRKRSEAGKKGGSASVGKVSRNRQASADQMPPYPDSESDLETLAKPNPSESESTTLREVSIEDMARSIYERLAPLARMKTGHDPMRIRQALERRASFGEDARAVARAAYAFAKHPWQQRDGGQHAAQIHKLIDVGFPPLWLQSGMTLAIPETIGGRPLEWTPPAVVGPPTPVAALSTITVDGHSFEVPAFETDMNSLLAERRIRHQLEIMGEWGQDRFMAQLWQRSQWGPPPGERGCKIWPSVLHFACPETKRASA
ncbi:MAG TPA: DUF1376 domain-containing protein [Caulobacteraceae bacterium]